MSAPVKKGWIGNADKLLKKYPKLEFVIYAAIVAIALLIYFSDGMFTQENKKEEVAGVQSEQSLEQRLTRTLQNIDGVGRVEVMISYSTSREIVPAMKVDSQQSGTDGGVSSNSQSSNPVTVQDKDGNGPMVLMEIEPQIRGVVIVAQGAEDMAVKMNLMRAAQTALDIPASKVEVFAMKEDGDEK